jgi:hypothetical protein
MARRGGLLMGVVSCDCKNMLFFVVMHYPTVSGGHFKIQVYIYICLKKSQNCLENDQNGPGKRPKSRENAGKVLEFGGRQIVGTL